LQTRLFRYPVSFLVYSEAFEKLPGPAKTYAYKRLAQILTAEKLEKDYAVLERYDRKAMLEILCETKPEFAAAVQKQSRIN
jgi:hypothetical protein